MIIVFYLIADWQLTVDRWSTDDCRIVIQKTNIDKEMIGEKSIEISVKSSPSEIGRMKRAWKELLLRLHFSKMALISLVRIFIISTSVQRQGVTVDFLELVPPHPLIHAFFFFVSLLFFSFFLSLSLALHQPTTKWHFSMDISQSMRVPLTRSFPSFVLTVYNSSNRSLFWINTSMNWSWRDHDEHLLR